MLTKVHVSGLPVCVLFVYHAIPVSLQVPENCSTVLVAAQSASNSQAMERKPGVEPLAVRKRRLAAFLDVGQVQQHRRDSVPPVGGELRGEPQEIAGLGVNGARTGTFAAPGVGETGEAGDAGEVPTPSAAMAAVGGSNADGGSVMDQVGPAKASSGQKKKNV